MWEYVLGRKGERCRGAGWRKQGGVRWGVLRRRDSGSIGITSDGVLGEMGTA